MRHLAVFALIGCLASLGFAQAETNPAPKGPKDQVISGDFTPDRVKSDQEAFAKKLQDSGKGPLPRGRNYYFAWGSMTPQEFEALGRNTVMLIAVWTQKGEELPVKLVHIRRDGEDVPVTKVSSWKTPVDGGSLTAKMYGPNREDGFYLVPGGAMLRKVSYVSSSAPTTQVGHSWNCRAMWRAPRPSTSPTWMPRRTRSRT